MSLLKGVVLPYALVLGENWSNIVAKDQSLILDLWMPSEMKISDIERLKDSDQSISNTLNINKDDLLSYFPQTTQLLG